ncbi:ATP-binding cassette domain-containing protein [Stenotrophomonas sp. HITSZ_GD]|uniref:ABC transporter ATP-binding protein n=1 Tax=Stenotrophomonas sp. HITSZ_GD TaxID=3037248 RepID=UPI00240E5C92|nr:ATP-binding cassette domain-containing protein [Stenotrophomonas sp. HITSZ_GD]MDG2526272.1 ATP-binding cassette domain-containing protein [Stenotrophomonas sp. HITSZ_GD]
MIQTVGLSHAYSAHAGVWDLDLTVPAGAIYAFLGPNGAGKTTTIRLLLGLLRATRGQILIDGAPRAADPRAVPHIGSMVEGPSLYPHLTGRENLRITALLLGRPRGEIDDALRTVGLLDAADRLVRQYSLGMRQRLGLALALLGRPRLLILDEPSNGLDPPGMADMRALMRELVREHGMTLFLSSHLLDDVEKVATHVGLLHKGRLLAQGELAALRERRLRVECGDPARAAALLAQAGHAAAVEAEGVLRVDAQASEAAHINRLLVTAGIDVHALGARHDSLERFFALATGKEGGA